MALQLRIISDHRKLLGERSSVAFDGAGGNIGRSTSNDWVLPDPRRFVSAHHARIHFRDGLYILEDTSTNGVFVNDEETPVANRGAHVLQNGDVLRLGDYQVLAILEASPVDSDSAGALLPPEMSGMFGSIVPGSVVVHSTPQNVEVVSSVNRVSQTDLNASLNLDQMLNPDPNDSGMSLPVNAYGQPTLPLPSSMARSARPQDAAPPSAHELSAVLGESDAERRIIARRIERLARAASRAQDRRTAANPPVPPDANSGLSAFCKGAGIAADHFAPELQGRMLHLAGQLLRETLVGLKDLERGRAEGLRPMQVEMAADSDDPRPSVAQAGVEDLLIQIMSQHESRRLDAVQWLREVIDRAKAHDDATFDALRIAFADFVTRLEPAELESRFGRHAGRAGDRGARNWQLYSEFYRSIAARSDGRLPRVFLDAFSTAYDEKLKTAQKPPDPAAG